MLLAPGCHHQLGTVAFGPLLQLLAGRVEGQPRGACEHACRDIALIFLDTIPHHLISLSHNLPGLYSTPSSLTSRSFTSSASVTCLANDSLGANEPMGVSIR